MEGDRGFVHSASWAWSVIGEVKLSISTLFDSLTKGGVVKRKALGYFANTTVKVFILFLDVVICHPLGVITRLPPLECQTI